VFLQADQPTRSDPWHFRLCVHLFNLSFVSIEQRDSFC